MSDRRDEIIEVAKEVFSENGVRASTVREIGARAGILSGSLYHHFDSKLAIVDAILRDYCDTVLADYERILVEDSDTEATLGRMVLYAFSMVRDHKAAVQIILDASDMLIDEGNFDYLVDFNRVVAGHWVGKLEEGVRTGVFRADLDPQVQYRLIRESLLGSIRWYRPGGRRSIDQISEQYAQTLFAGIRA